MIRLKTIVKHPVFITSAILLLLIWLLPFPFNQYKLETTFKVLNNESVSRVYYDLDKDGVSEFFRFRSSALTGNGTQMFVSRANGNIIYQTQYEEKYGDVANIDEFYFEDLFKTGYVSAAFFTRSIDSVYLFVFSIEDSVHNVYGYPVKKNISGEMGPSKIKWLGYKTNAIQEVLLYFWVDDSETLGSSEIMCFNVTTRHMSRFHFDSMNPQVEVIENDENKFSIVINTVSNRQIKEALAWEYGDMACRFMVLDENFNFLFDPVVLAESYGYADIVVLDNAETGRKNVFLFLWDFSIDTNNRKLIKMNLKGDIIFNANLFLDQVITDLLLIQDKENELYIKTEGRDYWLVDKEDGSLSKSIFAQINLDGYDYITSVQLDNKPGKEHVLFNNISNELIVYRRGFKNPASIEILDEKFYFDQFSVRKGKIFSLIIPGEIYINRLTYRSTNWVWLKYPYWLGIFLLLNLGVWLRSQLTRKRELELKAIESKITDLQLKNFRNQLDPHFTFNALNVIGSVIYKEDKDVAYDYFTRFSRLMRFSLIDSTNITRELDAEIQFTTDYLEFQKYRFKDKFDFVVNTGAGVERKMQVPKMLIQGYAENSVRHGFYQIDYQGMIEINTERTSDATVITVKDNGIGRKRAAELHTSKGSGIGMNVMEEQINLFNKYNLRHIEIKVVDLEEKGHAKGTLVKVSIPHQFSFLIAKPAK
ncbi:sensor histidine kinase [Saccharicrinis sp. FJH54]|uniref:sensor histidine kinase n=1 Tax=Saccharicrinis sp. FJH54 TaxID=3344665 RepID=UPI0035D3DC37